MIDANRRTLRTLVQTTLALAVTLPAIVDASGIPAALPWVAGALAVAGGLSRVMALPGVQSLLPPWLRAEPHVDDELLRVLHRREDATE
ncbi:hypothetical protein GCM10010329_17450 [Streptomyces spiroverticillatus]|uniref:Holin n=1 Tax=Streptomyces finlayi TaxID=67296 RepID=A0A919C7S5_9ACTN|nr:hypothetical protein [Streptomyces finlayi]GGZ96730.1 hypothetical protein GCM10010329_17450 [Streptomyces spiroverticillatus]GHC82029.1 hypothetical protein GCM10010334_09930 [Streptomyces finlayi]